MYIYIHTYTYAHRHGHNNLHFWIISFYRCISLLIVSPLGLGCQSSQAKLQEICPGVRGQPPNHLKLSPWRGMEGLPRQQIARNLGIFFNRFLILDFETCQNNKLEQPGAARHETSKTTGAQHQTPLVTPLSTELGHRHLRPVAPLNQKDGVDCQVWDDMELLTVPSVPSFMLD